MSPQVDYSEILVDSQVSCLPRISVLAKELIQLRKRIHSALGSNEGPPRDTSASAQRIQTRSLADLLKDAASAAIQAQAQARTISLSHLLLHAAPTLAAQFEIAELVGSTTACVGYTDIVVRKYAKDRYLHPADDSISMAADRVTEAYLRAPKARDRTRSDYNQVFPREIAKVGSFLAEAACALHDASIAVQAQALTCSVSDLAMKVFTLTTQAQALEISLANLIRNHAAPTTQSSQFVALVRDLSRCTKNCLESIDDAVVSAQTHDQDQQHNPALTAELTAELAGDFSLAAHYAAGVSKMALDASEAHRDDFAFSCLAANLGSVLGEAAFVLYDAFIAVQAQVPVAPHVYPWPKV